jgi:hypothetical protein
LGISREWCEGNDLVVPVVLRPCYIITKIEAKRRYCRLTAHGRRTTHHWFLHASSQRGFGKGSPRYSYRKTWSGRSRTPATSRGRLAITPYIALQPSRPGPDLKIGTRTPLMLPQLPLRVVERHLLDLSHLLGESWMIHSGSLVISALGPPRFANARMKEWMRPGFGLGNHIRAILTACGGRNRNVHWGFMLPSLTFDVMKSWSVVPWLRYGTDWPCSNGFNWSRRLCIGL